MSRIKLDGFRYEFDKDSKVVGIITESEELISFHLKPDTDTSNFLNSLKIPITSSNHVINLN